MQNCDDIISQWELISKCVFLLSNIIITEIHLHVCTLVFAFNRITFQLHKSEYVTQIWWKETMQSDRLSTVQNALNPCNPSQLKTHQRETWELFRVCIWCDICWVMKFRYFMFMDYILLKLITLLLVKHLLLNFPNYCSWICNRSYFISLWSCCACKWWQLCRRF